MALDATIGGASADTYATLAEYEARATAMGWTLDATDTLNERHLRRAAVALDASYRWIGQQQYQTQALGWPRSGAGYVDGWYIDPDTIPQAVKDAQMEMAQIIAGGTDPLATLDATIKRERLGPMETEYLDGMARPRFTAVDRLLRGYIVGGAGQVQAVRG